MRWSDYCRFYFMKKILPFCFISVCLLLSCKKNSTCEKGPVNQNCICPLNANLVCGCNNQTYYTPCDAQCDGITTYSMGHCP